MKFYLKTLLFSSFIIIFGFIASWTIQGKITSQVRRASKLDRLTHKLSEDNTQKEQMLADLNRKSRIVEIATTKLGLIDPNNDPDLICFVEITTSKDKKRINHLKLLDFFTSTIYANELK